MSPLVHFRNRRRRAVGACAARVAGLALSVAGILAGAGVANAGDPPDAGVSGYDSAPCVKCHAVQVHGEHKDAAVEKGKE